VKRAKRKVYVHTEPDALGRQRFTITWTDPKGVYRQEVGPDGEVVGYRRGQVFFAKLIDHVRPGDEILEDPEARS